MGSGGAVTIEAENYVELYDVEDPDRMTWTVQTAQAGYSGTGYVQATSGGSQVTSWDDNGCGRI